MKKVFLTLFAMVMMVALFATSNHQSFAVELGTYTSGFQVANLEGTAANIVMTFYRQDGTVEATVSDTIPANGSNTYATVPSVSAGFNGSAVISSDQPIAAISNLTGDVTQKASYGGFSEGSSTVSLPLIYKDFFDIDSWFNVQNSGSSSVDITITFSGQPNCTIRDTIAQPGAAKSYRQADDNCLPAGYLGAATIRTTDSADSIVVSALQVSPSALLSYNGFGAGSQNPVMPLIASNVFGYSTGVQIQNQGTQNTNVTITYTPAGQGNGTQCTETRSVTAGASTTFTLDAFDSDGSSASTCVAGQYFVGSAAVTTNSGSQPLVAVVNQTNFVNQGSSYNAFDPSTATNTVIMPLIMDAYSIFTGYNVLNVGTSSTTVTCDYSGIGSQFNDTATLAVGQAMNRVQINKNYPANTGGGYVGSATCTATGSGAILGVVNQNITGGRGDTVLTYEAFNE